MKNLLFINHEESRTGAPFVLLQFLQWLKQRNSECIISVLSLREGPLRTDFEAVADSYYQLSGPEAAPTLMDRIFQKKGKKAGRDTIKLLSAKSFDLIYANTIVSLPVAFKLKSLNRNSRLVVHVHELKTVIKTNLPDFKVYVSGVDGFIAVSELVRDNLISNYNIPSEKVRIIYEFSKKMSPANMKKSSSFVVGGSGTGEWRKGTDLFIQVAAYVKRKYPGLQIKFIWVGKIKPAQRLMYEAEIEKAGLKGIFNFSGEKADPQEEFSHFDIFLLTSREDPFPLVCIELGMMGKPIICFEKATGTAEILTKGGGAVVPYLNIEKMAEKVVDYYNDRQKLNADGERAKQLFSSFTVENLAPEIYKFLCEGEHSNSVECCQ
ncbi:Glycosyltransferase involved in cell wall bisynthesis [Salinimicrobium catena]|uniref:Glycosyltransferase involved in cell wall bisynthesis n=1 Tax=Salinimicrobium catena TaxID=390640 RepID=A0A1H5NAR0_9FLAO|nr:glycosyltransferase family 4 protein [Salinimicrobium catena]SDL41380.1 Glycosyltransferase involved in cell wall bisynthesis [Salinimicrobium catena]SEE98663.1 Glycosyltransferase involved in cell wall bisynthesis [Salinimicrobium catena]